MSTILSAFGFSIPIFQRYSARASVRQPLTFALLHSAEARPACYLCSMSGHWAKRILSVIMGGLEPAHHRSPVRIRSRFRPVKLDEFIVAGSVCRLRPARDHVGPRIRQHHPILRRLHEERLGVQPD